MANSIFAHRYATASVLKRIKSKTKKGKVPNLGYFFDETMNHGGKLKYELVNLDAEIRKLNRLPAELVRAFEALQALEANPTMDKINPERVKAQIKAVQNQFFIEDTAMGRVLEQIATIKKLHAYTGTALKKLEAKTKQFQKAMKPLEREFDRVSTPILGMTYQQFFDDQVERPANQKVRPAVEVGARASKRANESLFRRIIRGFGG
jgi:hypothetical protein